MTEDRTTTAATDDFRDSGIGWKTTPTRYSRRGSCSRNRCRNCHGNGTITRIPRVLVFVLILTVCVVVYTLGLLQFLGGGATTRIKDPPEEPRTVASSSEQSASTSTMDSNNSTADLRQHVTHIPPGATTTTAATGNVFSGQKIRTYTGPRRRRRREPKPKQKQKQKQERPSSAPPATTATIGGGTPATDTDTDADTDTAQHQPLEQQQPHEKCTHWIVITTIYAPSEAVRRAAVVAATTATATETRWCTVIVADTQTPQQHAYLATLYALLPPSSRKKTTTNTTTTNTHNNNNDTTKNIIFLSVQKQKDWIQREHHHSNNNNNNNKKDRSTSSRTGSGTAVGRFLQQLPYDSFGRKNVGYLYAIQHGARSIFDLDDDNLLPLTTRTATTPTTTGTEEDDDDNEGEEMVVLPPIYNTTYLTGAGMVITGPIVFNHHELMGAAPVAGGTGVSWPRGFPLSEIYNTATQGRILYEQYGPIPIEPTIGIFQFVADQNPDVDALQRLLFPHMFPMTFQRHIKYATATTATATAARSSITTNTHLPPPSIATEGALLVPSHTYVPYNAQATLHTYKALWSMLLPITVSGRVSDIWRSYFAQRIFREIDTSSSSVPPHAEGETSSTSTSNMGGGLKVVILPPDITQDRNEHNILADMQAEHDLYYKTDALIRFLNDWEYTTNTNTDVDDDDSDSDDDTNTIQACIESLWIELYERDYIDVKDVTMMQLWLDALNEVGYAFPRITPKRDQKIYDVAVMGQFNFPNYHVSENWNEIEEYQPHVQQDDDPTNTKSIIDERVVTDLIFWYQKWKQKFHHVVIRGPFSSQLVDVVRNHHYIDIHPTRKSSSSNTNNNNNNNLFYDKGYVSPMDNLRLTLNHYYYDPANKYDNNNTIDHNDHTKQTRNGYNPSSISVATKKKVKGVVYVHDDMLINFTNVFFGRQHHSVSDDDGHWNNHNKESTILATHSEFYQGKKFNNNSLSEILTMKKESFMYRIHYQNQRQQLHSGIHNDHDGATAMYFTKPDGYRTDNTTELLNSFQDTNEGGFPFHWLTLHGFIKVVQDERYQKYMESDHNEDGSASLFVSIPHSEQSDFVYIPTSLAKEYDEIAQIFIDHNVFLECGFPKIIELLLLSSTRINTASSNSSSGRRSSSSGSSGRNHKTRSDSSYDNDSGDENKNNSNSNGAFGSSLVGFRPIDLCTSWDYVFKRGSLLMIEDCVSPSSLTNSTTTASYAKTSHSSSSSSQFTPSSVIHPFKMTKHGYKIWDRTFDFVMTGKANINIKDISE